MGFFSRLFGGDKTKDKVLTGESLDKERMSQMLQRQSSFSLIAIPGDVESEMPSFLSACEYKISRTGHYDGAFEDLYGSLEAAFDPDNLSTVHKAWFQAAGHTILLDPEMVLVTNTAERAKLAEKIDGSVKIAIWERVSESVVLVEIGAEGVMRETWYAQGERTEEGKNEHSEITLQPDDSGLKKALAKYGLSGNAIFGDVSSTLVELQE